MLLTTTNTVENQQIVEYLGVVGGEAILGANLVKDLLARVTDVIGGRASSYERELAHAKQLALEEMQAQAQALGADAVVGIDFDYETVGNRASMLLVTVSGTAVKLN